MKRYTVTAAMDGKHVVKASQMAFPALEASDLYRALKHKDIRVDGRKISNDIAVNEGSEVEVWLPDSLFDGEERSDPAVTFKKVAETDGLLLVNKPQGLPVHSGKNTGDANLIDIIRKKSGYPEAELVHRIDMNTGGILMVAKNKKYLEDAIKLFSDNLLIKRYRALMLGVPKGGEPVICEDEAVMLEVSAFLEKTSGGKVYIHDEKHPGDLPIATRYRVLNVYKGIGPSGEDVSDVELELVTGRTHQIRAQFAHMGNPVIGDGNYGRNNKNSFFKNMAGGKVRYQQLFATTLLLRKIPADNLHRELSGRKFSIEPAFDVDLGRKKNNRR